MTIIFNNFFIFPFQFVDNSGCQFLNRTVPVVKQPSISHAKRGRIVDMCTKSGWKGIPNLHDGGRNDKVKVYLICMKRVQKVDERV